MTDLTDNEFFKLTTKDTSEIVLCIAVDKIAKTTFCISSQNGGQFLQHCIEENNFDLLKNVQQFLSDTFHIEDLKLVVQSIKVSKEEKKLGSKTETKDEKLEKRHKLFSGKKVQGETYLKSRSGRKIKPPKWMIEQRKYEKEPGKSHVEDEMAGGELPDNADEFSEAVCLDESGSKNESKEFKSKRATHRSETLCNKEKETPESTHKLDLSCNTESDIDEGITNDDCGNNDNKSTTSKEIDRKCCPTCGLKFKTKYQLKKHIEIHGEHQYPCDICGKKFRLRRYVHRHKIETHKIQDNAGKEVDNSDKKLEESLAVEKEGLEKEEEPVLLFGKSEKTMEVVESETLDRKSSCEIMESDTSIENQKSNTKFSSLSDKVSTAMESPSDSLQVRDFEEIGQHQHEDVQAKEDNGKLTVEAETNNVHVSSNDDDTQEEITITFIKHPVTKKLQCNMCTETFVSKYNLSRHLLRKHDYDEEIKVVMAEKNEEDFAEPQNTGHSSQVSCHKCSETFFSDFEKIRHELEVHDLVIAEKYHGPAKRGKVKCPICKTKRESIQTLKLHVRSHYEIDMSEVTCHICKMQFKTKNRLQNHMLIHSEANIPCNICGKKFRLVKYVKRHIAEFHKKVPDIEIPKKERSKPALKEKKDQTPGICDICGKVFQSKYKALQHRSSHDSQKNLPCPVCGKMFGLQRTLNTHMKIHGESRDYICEVCGKAFKISQGLRMHRLRYHDKTEYKCDLCDRKFLSGSGKKYHMFKDHKEFAMKNEDLKKFPCKYCDRVCSGSQEYLRHLSRHEDNRTQFCDICNRGFSTVSQLNVHRKVHFAQVKRFACKICRFKTLTPYKLRRHLASSKHIENCSAIGITNVSVATDIDNSNIVDKLPGKNCDNENITSDSHEIIDQSDVDFQGETNVVTIEMHNNEADEEGIEVKYLEIPENLEGSQIIYTDSADMIYSVIQESEAEGTSTFIFDPSVNQAVESILKLQKS